MFICRGYTDGASPCSATFTRSEHLARHVRKHTGERPFKCHCGRAFSRLDNVRQHAGTVHAEQATRNAAMMAALVSLHNALSAAASASQQEAGMVISKEGASAHARARSGSASGSNEEKKPKVAKRAKYSASPASERRSLASSTLQSPHGAYLPSSSYHPISQQLHPLHQSQISPNHPQYPPYSAPYPYTSSSTTPPLGEPIYAQSEGSGPAPPSSRRRATRPTSLNAVPTRYYGPPMSYGPNGTLIEGVADANGPVPASPSRITLPSISQLLPSPFGRPQSGQNPEEQVYYSAGANGELGPTNGRHDESGFISPSYPLPPQSLYQQNPSMVYYNNGFEQEQYHGREDVMVAMPRVAGTAYPLRSDSVSSVGSSHGSLSNSSSFSGDTESHNANYAYALHAPTYATAPYSAKQSFPPFAYGISNQVGHFDDAGNNFNYAETTPRLFNNGPPRDSSERSNQHSAPHYSSHHSQHADSPVYSSLPNPMADQFDYSQQKRVDYSQQPSFPRTAGPPAWEYPSYEQQRDMAGMPQMGMSMNGAPRVEEGNNALLSRKRSRDESVVEDPREFARMSSAAGRV